jgi:hypothetical protein
MSKVIGRREERRQVKASYIHTRDFTMRGILLGRQLRVRAG